VRNTGTYYITNLGRGLRWNGWRARSIDLKFHFNGHGKWTRLYLKLFWSWNCVKILTYFDRIRWKLQILTFLNSTFLSLNPIPIVFVKWNPASRIKNGDLTCTTACLLSGHGVCKVMKSNRRIKSILVLTLTFFPT
jgi:hypothetical protein